MWIEQVPDNYPTMVVRKKKTHTKKNTRRSDGREKGAGMGGYRIRVVQEISRRRSSRSDAHARGAPSATVLAPRGC